MKYYIKASHTTDNAFYGSDVITILDDLSSGTPVLVDCGNGTYIQTIYMGVGEIQYRPAYMFYDGSGISGTFGLSAKYIRESGDAVSIILDNNEPTVVARLLKELSEDN